MRDYVKTNASGRPTDMAECQQRFNHNGITVSCTLEAGHTRPHYAGAPHGGSREPKDPYQNVIDRILALKKPASQRSGRIPDAILEAVSVARERGLSYKNIYETLGEEWYTTVDSFASSHRHWLKRNKANDA